MSEEHKTEEHKRLHERHGEKVPPWQKWGPYVSERAWGTVREDCSENKDPWSSFPHDQARSRAYRWGEDGIAGFCDRYQVLVFAPAFWNGKDPIIKERLFGTNFWEGNHGEDVKECYYHLDGTPTHSYMKYLYKYPQKAFPYGELIAENKRRSPLEGEYELVETGIFSENRYFDIFIEYAKSTPEDICIRITAHNRGPDTATLHILPHLWFRNQWSFSEESIPRPEISIKSSHHGIVLIADEKDMPPPPNLPFSYQLGKRYLYAPKDAQPLFTHNESSLKFEAPYAKDAFHLSVIQKKDTLIENQKGTKSALHYTFEIPAGDSRTLLLRLSDQKLKSPLTDINAIIDQRKKEADQFYNQVLAKHATEEERKIQRQALAGILWSKQIYLYDVNEHLESCPFSHNEHWRHLKSKRILLMPDKWEYPWFAAWDLAFQTLSLGLIDIEQAKDELWYLLFEQFQHPNGQIPAYEWEFSDLNPPVQAWAALTLMKMEEEQTGKIDLNFLKKCFHKLLINFTWWVNKVDTEGYNVFEGGFLGLDNITVIDRSTTENGNSLEQSDATGWMAFFSLNLMRMALIIAKEDRSFESLAVKFFQHFVYIAHAMKRRDHEHYELWSEKDGFFYDVIREPSGTFTKLRIRSLIGLIPLYAVELISKEELNAFPEFAECFYWFLNNRGDLTDSCIFDVPKKDHYVLSIVNQEQLKRILKYVWDPKEFRANYGLRSLSRYHEKHPFTFESKQVGYEPAESIHRIKGGNSNWRGPIWFPTSYLFIESLEKFYQAYGNTLQIHIPEEKATDLRHMAQGFAEKMISIFKKDEQGHRPYLGKEFRFNDDPHFVDHLLFYEHFHPETGRGLGASHQTGWTALVANLIAHFKKQKFKDAA